MSRGAALRMDVDTQAGNVGSDATCGKMHCV